MALVAPLGLAAYWMQRRALDAPLIGLLRFAQQMAAGDLTQRMQARGDDLVGRLQQALIQLNVNLQTVVGDARSEVEQMEVGVADIAAGNRDMSASNRVAGQRPAADRGIDGENSPAP